MRMATAWLVCTACAVTTLDAQVRVVRRGDDRLSGITAVDVVVKDLNTDAVSCGVAPTALQETAVATLRAAGIMSSGSGMASSWFYTFYVTARSVVAERQCVTSLTAELMAHVSGIPESDQAATNGAWGSLLVGQMPLAREAGPGQFCPCDHGSRVVANVRTHAGRNRSENEGGESHEVNDERRPVGLRCRAPVPDRA